MVCSVVMGISWFRDSINCIVPASHGIGGGFISATCWIQGVYVYKELSHRVDNTAYFGIPKDITNDGYLKSSKSLELCNTEPRFGEDKPDPDCIPMEKTFYLQYQWMPFLIGALALLFYLPYMFHLQVNKDLISLKTNVSGGGDAKKIVKTYFNPKVNTNLKWDSCVRILLNIVVKILYFVANIVAFFGIDILLNKQFKNYGQMWIQWSNLPNSIQLDYMGLRVTPKPGDYLLPPFGYCEIYESAKDIKVTVANRHKFLCELSQNILYQYALIVLWFALIVGMVVSLIGLIVLIVHYVVNIFGVRHRGPSGRQLYKSLTARELEYLEFIRKKNIQLYGEVLDQLAPLVLNTGR